MVRRNKIQRHNNNNNNNNNSGSGSGSGGGCDSVQYFSSIRVLTSSNQLVTREHNSTIQQNYLIAQITIAEKYNLCTFFHNDENITKTPQHAPTRDGWPTSVALSKNNFKFVIVQSNIFVSRYLMDKVQVKCTLVQALRLCTGPTARRGSRGIALPFHDRGTRRGWGVSVTLRPLFTPGKTR